MYKKEGLDFANSSSYKLLVDDDQPDFRKVAIAVERNNQLKNITALTEDQCVTQINYQYSTESSKPLSVNTFLMKLQNCNSCKVCILQDQSELEKEKEAKAYLKKFFAMITHELRNPLQGVLGIFESLLETFKGSKDGIYQCQTGISTAKLMMRLISDLLDLEQMETGKFQLVSEQANVLELINECIDLMQFKYRTKGVELFCRQEGAAPKISCDKSRYKQILLNLLGNAIKFTEKGQVIVTVKYDPAEYKIVTTVQDTGVGIKPEDQGKLFTFFGRLESHQMANPQGVGLGLYICKRLCEAMGGVIKLKSEYLKGTTITFSIATGSEEPQGMSLAPVKVSSEKVESVEGSPAPPYNSPYPFITSANTATHNAAEEKTVLVVDDEFICGCVLQNYLKSYGAGCDTVLFWVMYYVNRQHLDYRL